jgi:hypothetical protein
MGLCPVLSTLAGERLCPEILDTARGPRETRNNVSLTMDASLGLRSAPPGAQLGSCLHAPWNITRLLIIR